MLDHVGVAGLAKLGNPKATLATLLEEESFPPANYQVVKSSGGKNADAVHLVEVYTGDRLLGEGAGFTVEMAEAEAAKAALLKEYTTEVEDVVLPSSWGDFAAADAEDLIVKMFAQPTPSDDSDE